MSNASGISEVNQSDTSLLKHSKKTKLNRQQIAVFWSSWLGFGLDGMDGAIYALVLVPALTDLLPNSEISVSPGAVGFYGSILFGLFLIGWACASVWGSVADRFGRRNTLVASIVIYALATGLSALSANVYILGFLRFVVGFGSGAQWNIAGTYVAESWPEDRRQMGAGYLQTGAYFGFFLASLLNYTIGAAFGWRAMFLVGLLPVVLIVFVLMNVKESDKWHQKNKNKETIARPLRAIFNKRHRKQTTVMALLVTVAIVGLWAGSIYVPTAIVQLAHEAHIPAARATHLASIATAVLSIGTVVGCLAAPILAQRYGRRRTLGIYFLIMLVMIIIEFAWVFYSKSSASLTLFIGLAFILGFGGGDFAMFSLWLPELFPTEVRASAFGFCTSIGRLVGAFVNFALGAAVLSFGTLGIPVAWTAVAFVIGLMILPFARETRGQKLPN